MSFIWGSTPRYTDWLTINHNVTLTLYHWKIRDWVRVKPSAWVHNWAILFLEDINTRIWPYRLGKVLETVKYGQEYCSTWIWEWLSWQDPSAVVNYRPIIWSERDPTSTTPNYLTVIKIWSWAPDGCLTSRQDYRLAKWPLVVTKLLLWLSRQIAMAR
jgi:hypothetical protein